MLTKNNFDEQLQPALSNNSNFKIIKVLQQKCKNIIVKIFENTYHHLLWMGAAFLMLFLAMVAQQSSMK